MLNMKALREIDPVKAELIDDIFGYRINGLSIPTYNVSRHELSDTFTHSYAPRESGYAYERLEIKRSCEEGIYVTDKTYMVPGIYIPAYKLPIEILKAIKHEVGNVPYLDWLYDKLLNQMLQFKVKIPQKNNLFSIRYDARDIYFSNRQDTIFYIYCKKITGNNDLYQKAFRSVAWSFYSREEVISILENSPQLVGAINWFTEAYKMLYI